MFEGQSQTELDAMMKANSEFRQLYFRHKELDKQVLDAELGVLPIDDTTLGQMKREKTRRQAAPAADVRTRQLRRGPGRAGGALSNAK